jgi:hypothetical protein
MSRQVSAYKHIENVLGRNRGQASSYYHKATSFVRLETDKGFGYSVNDNLLPKRFVCSKCEHWHSQNQTKAIIKLLRKGFGRTAKCSQCSYVYDSLESAFCSY